MKSFIHLALAFLLAVISWHCEDSPPGLAAAKVAIADPLPTREVLMQQLRQSEEIVVVYQPGPLQQVAELIRDRAKRKRVKLFSLDSINITVLGKTPTMVLGSLDAPLVQQLCQRLPLQAKDGAICLGEYQFRSKSTLALLSVYPNPYGTQQPLSLAMGFNDKQMAAVLTTRLSEGWFFYSWSSWGYEVLEQGQRVLAGDFDSESWAFDKKIHYDFTRPPDTLAEPGIFHFVSHGPGLNQVLLRPALEQGEEAGRQILAFTGLPAPAAPIVCHLYGSAEQKGLMRANSQQADADFEEGTAHIVINAVYAHNHIGKENAVLLRQLLGPPKISALEEGLAIHFTDQWQERGYAYWAARLYQSGNLAPLEELLDNESFQRESSLVMGCLSASFVDCLIDHWGKEAFLERYANWQPGAEEIRELEAHWHQHLSQPQSQSQSTLPLPYLKGFNFAHEGYAVYNGYGSQLSRQSLEAQAALGASALAIVPYSYMEDANRPSFIPVVTRAGMETDEGLVQDAYTARQLGMAVVLKPQIWLGRNWPGDVEMKTEKDWALFFDYYYRWMRHYALLAEINHMDMLCVGVEFAKATLQRPEDWRRLIHKLRGLYSGPLTYSANWGQEFENLTFWEELDYIGLNCYYPLSQEENPSDEALRAAFGRVLKLAQQVSEQHHKPLLFTEIGFTSTPTPWKEPHKDRNGAPYQGEAQERCYRIVMESLRGQPWCRGILWWKYPSYLSQGGPGQTGFTPNGKPAEKEVKKGFGKLP